MTRDDKGQGTGAHLESSAALRLDAAGVAARLSLSLQRQPGALRLGTPWASVSKKRWRDHAAAEDNNDLASMPVGTTEAHPFAFSPGADALALARAKASPPWSARGNDGECRLTAG